VSGVGPRFWPDARALLDELAAHMEGQGQTLALRSVDDLEAGLARGPLAESYGEGDLFDLAALLFDGVATRHSLVDGNKRLAFLGMVAFLTLNGAYLDAPEAEVADLCIAVVARERGPADLAAYLRARC
jgi:death-on-curing protein